MADLSVTAAEVLAYAGATVKTGLAGETITAGMTVYLKSDGLLWKAKALTAAEAAAAGITLNGAAAGQPIQYVQAGGIDPGATVVVGVVYGVTDTAGGIGDVAERTTPDFVTVLGIGVTASRIELNIQAGGIGIPE